MAMEDTRLFMFASRTNPDLRGKASTQDPQSSTSGHMTPKRLSTPILALGIAVSGFLFSSTDAFAGPKENAAIAAKLQLSGDTFASATSAELETALRLAILDPINKKLKPTNLTGEALKSAGVNATDAGTVIGAAFKSNPPVGVAGTDLNKFAAGAAVAASTGSGANATNVPDFAAEFVANNTEALTVAKFATKSTTAIGAIIGGRAQDADVNTDVLRAGLANAAIIDKKLKKAVQQISQYVGATADNAPAFATAVASANLGSLQKIATGVATSNSTEADAIVDALIAGTATGTQTKKLASKIAKSVGTVADIEQVQLLSVTFGNVVTSKQVKSVAKALVQAISSRKPANGTGSLSLTNKADEVGEVVAYFTAALKTNTLTSATFNDAKAAGKLVLSIAQTMFKAAKVKTDKKIPQKSTDLQDALVAKPGNFAASLAYTITQMGLSADVVAEITKQLTGSAAAKIGGAKYKAQLVAQFQLGFAGDGVAGPATGYENGTAVGSVVDPETDTRNS
jgi:hypothetical protein